MQKKIIIVSGPPAGGKGFRINALLEKLGQKSVRVSLSAESAIERHNQTPLGRWLCLREEKGDLFPDMTAVTMTLQKLDRHPDKEFIIFDGVPRTILQAREIIPFFKEQLEYQVISIHVTCNHDVCRRRCTNPDRVDRIDNKDFEKRLRTYCELTAPMIPYLSENTDYHYEVSGEGSIKDFFKSLTFADNQFQKI